MIAAYDEYANQDLFYDNKNLVGTHRPTTSLSNTNNKRYATTGGYGGQLPVRSMTSLLKLGKSGNGQT